MTFLINKRINTKLFLIEPQLLSLGETQTRVVPNEVRLHKPIGRQSFPCAAILTRLKICGKKDWVSAFLEMSLKVYLNDFIAVSL